MLVSMWGCAPGVVILCRASLKKCLTNSHETFEECWLTYKVVHLVICLMNNSSLSVYCPWFIIIFQLLIFVAHSPKKYLTYSWNFIGILVRMRIWAPGIVDLFSISRVIAFEYVIICIFQQVPSISQNIYDQSHETLQKLKGA
jgi:hypothetical protein